MRCAEVRERLLQGATAATTAGLDEHLHGCSRCAAFAADAAAFRAGLRARQAGIEPGPEFAARVVARLPGTPEMLGWASLRLLPAALALAALLSWYGTTHGPGLTDLLLHPEDPQLLTYVALGGER